MFNIFQAQALPSAEKTQQLDNCLFIHLTTNYLQ